MSFRLSLLLLLAGIALPNLAAAQSTPVSPRPLSRVAIGLPSIAGGVGIGALVDALNSKDARPKGVAVNVRW